MIDDASLFSLQNEIITLYQQKFNNIPFVISLCVWNILNLVERRKLNEQTEEEEEKQLSADVCVCDDMMQ